MQYSLTYVPLVYIQDATTKNLPPFTPQIFLDNYSLFRTIIHFLSNISKKGKDSQLVRSRCKQDNNSDNGEKEEDNDLSKVVHYQRIDGGESVVYTSWWFKKYIWKYRHLKFDNQQPREFKRKKHFKLFSIGKSCVKKLLSISKFWKKNMHITLAITTSKACEN